MSSSRLHHVEEREASIAVQHRQPGNSDPKLIITLCLVLLQTSPTRNFKVAKRFLGKVLQGLKDWEKPTVINTDRALTYVIAI